MLLLLLSLLTVQNGWAAENRCLKVDLSMHPKDWISGSVRLKGYFQSGRNTPSYCCDTQFKEKPCGTTNTLVSSNSSSVQSTPVTSEAAPTCDTPITKEFKTYTYSSLHDAYSGLFAWLNKSDNDPAVCCDRIGSVNKRLCREAIAAKSGSYSSSSTYGKNSLSDREERIAGGIDKLRDKNEKAEEAKRIAEQETRNRGYAAAARKTVEDKAKAAKERLEKARSGETISTATYSLPKDTTPQYSVSKEEEILDTGIPSSGISNPHEGKEIALKPNESFGSSSSEPELKEQAPTVKELRKSARQAAREARAMNSGYDEKKECGNFNGTSCKATDNINAAANTAVTQMNNVLQMNVENRNAEAQSAVTQKGLAATQEDALRANAQAAWNGANAAQNSAIAQGAVAAYKAVRAAQHGRDATENGRVAHTRDIQKREFEAAMEDAETEEEKAYYQTRLNDLSEQAPKELQAQSEKAGTQIVETGNTLAGMATKIFEAIQGKKAQKSLNKMADELPANQGTGFTFWNPNSTDANTNQDQMQVTEVPNGAVTSNIPIDENVVAPDNLYDPSQLDQGALDGTASPYAAGAGAAPGGAGLSGLGGGGGGTSAAQNEEKNEAPIKNGSAGKYAAGEGGSKARGGSGSGGGAKIGLQGIEKSLQDLMNQALADKKEEIKKGVDPSQRDIAAEGSYVHGRDTNIFKKVTESYQRHAPELPSS